MYCIVLYLYIYIALLAVHTNQKRFQCKRPREKRVVLRERKEALGGCVRVYFGACVTVCVFIHSFVPAISIAPLQVLYYSEALPTTARILYRSFTPKRTGNCM